MQKQLLPIITIFWFTVSTAAGQITPPDSTYRKYFVGSSLFVLGNLIPQNRPDFVQLNVGYRVTPKNIVSVEVKTWKYAWSLGIPYGKSFEAPEEKFPGYIREYGVALAYQRFWWQGLYTAIHVMNARQTYVNEGGQKIGNGYQIFNTYRLGYQCRLLKNKFFIEPSVAVTHRPIQSKMPESFARLNDKWPNYFIGEPGLHFGFNF